MTVYACDECDYDYDPEVGDPDNGIKAGVSFKRLPEDWVCPECGAGKSQFSPVPDDEPEDEGLEEDEDPGD